MSRFRINRALWGLLGLGAFAAVASCAHHPAPVPPQEPEEAVPDTAQATAGMIDRSRYLCLKPEPEAAEQSAAARPVPRDVPVAADGAGGAMSQPALARSVQSTYIGAGAPSARLATGAGGKRASGSTIDPAMASGNGMSVEERPEGSDDDVIARRLKRAAETASDPQVRARLWRDYEVYEGRAAQR